MEKYLVDQMLTELKSDPERKDIIFLLFSSGEIDKKLSIPELEDSLRHMPAVRLSLIHISEPTRLL